MSGFWVVGYFDPDPLPRWPLALLIGFGTLAAWSVCWKPKRGSKERLK
jgi:hypothetical protein